MKFFYLLAGSLATFRLALMISSETGPMRIFQRLRKAPKPHSNLREGLSCNWCTGAWIGAAVATYLFHLDIFPGNEWPLWWLAISAGSVALNQILIAPHK